MGIPFFSCVIRKKNLDRALEHTFILVLVGMWLCKCVWVKSILVQNQLSPVSNVLVLTYISAYSSKLFATHHWKKKKIYTFWGKATVFKIESSIKRMVAIRNLHRPGANESTNWTYKMMETWVSHYQRGNNCNLRRIKFKPMPIYIAVITW